MNKMILRSDESGRAYNPIQNANDYIRIMESIVDVIVDEKTHEFTAFDGTKCTSAGYYNLCGDKTVHVVKGDEEWAKLHELAHAAFDIAGMYGKNNELAEDKRVRSLSEAHSMVMEVMLQGHNVKPYWRMSLCNEIDPQWITDIVIEICDAIGFQYTVASIMKAIAFLNERGFEYGDKEVVYRV